MLYFFLAIFKYCDNNQMSLSLPDMNFKSEYLVIGSFAELAIIYFNDSSEETSNLPSVMIVGEGESGERQPEQKLDANKSYCP